MLTGRSWGIASRSSDRQAGRKGRLTPRAAATLVLVATALAFWPSAAQADTGDTVTGFGTISPNSWHCATNSAGSFEIAVTGTGDPAATGTFSFSCGASPTGYPAITFSGAVECMRLIGTRAIIGGTITATNEAVFPVGEPLHFAAGDGGVGSGDAISDLYYGNACDDNLPTNIPIVGEISLYESPQCSDGRDNDGDGSIDFPADPGCTSATDASEAPNPECSDSFDNDGDGTTDYPADPGCTSATDTTESPNPTQCNDDVDNDGDGFVDYPADPGCTSATDDTESPNPPPPAQCNDGLDNDGDGTTDYPADPGCTSAADDTESPNPTQCNDERRQRR